MRGGGVGSLMGFAGGCALAVTALPQDSVACIASVAFAAIAIGILGLVEDIRGLSVKTRLVLQFLVGASLLLSLSTTTEVGWVWFPLAILFFAANVNFTNFMDGINGISGLHGLVAGLAYAAFGVVEAMVWLIVVGLITAVVFAAFLPWNLVPPRMFLGDVGSYLLGGALGAMAISALIAGLNPVAALAPLSIYWVDTLTTLAGRIRRREPFLQAHCSHSYQRLTGAGVPHIAVASVVALFTLGASLVGFLAASGTLTVVLSLALILMLGLLYLGLPRLFSFRRPNSVPPAPSAIATPLDAEFVAKPSSDGRGFVRTPRQARGLDAT
ncbi:MAG: UDP-phosphate alpha-N-acetylglucosaminyltransferase [Brooklawnia sp.]|nr:UDP-phosphate alpha-N-acetylglucosaminyltransferase [Brooklawnia sp.]